MEVRGDGGLAGAGKFSGTRPSRGHGSSKSFEQLVFFGDVFLKHDKKIQQGRPQVGGALGEAVALQVRIQALGLGLQLDVILAKLVEDCGNFWTGISG